MEEQGPITSTSGADQAIALPEPGEGRGTGRILKSRCQQRHFRRAQVCFLSDGEDSASENPNVVAH